MSNEKLFKVAIVLMGQSPPSSSCSANGDGIPFIQGNAEFGVRFPAPKFKCITPTRVAEQGDLLLSVRAPVGEMNQAHQKMVIGRGLSAIRFPTEDQPFAWHSLNSAVSRLNRVAQGSTFVAVNRNDVESLDIPWFPDKILRQNIAYVLETIDETIAQTEAVIAKLKQVRAGMLHDLLSYGLDENGQLRDPVEHPEQFRDSPLGRIPKEWTIGTVKSLAVNRDSKRIPVKQADRESRHGLFPYYGASGIIDYIDDFIFEGTFVLIGEDGENLRSRQLPLAFIASGRFWVNNHAHILEPLPETDVRFLATILENQDYIPWLLGSAQPKLTQKNLEIVPLRIPLQDEQKRISDALDIFDDQIYSEVLELKKLKSLKSGLQDDLLTGRVKVPESIMDSLNMRMTRVDEGGAG